jgi:hypothetical protein
MKNLKETLNEAKVDKKLIKFINDWLPKKVSYNIEVTKDDYEYYDIKTDNDSVIVDLRLQCGKGYGSNFRSKVYYFDYREHLNSYWCSNDKLYDNDKEAQIVRKFVNAITNFYRANKISLPNTVTINVEQELD